MQPDINLDQDREDALTEILRLVEENNKIVKGLRSRARVSMFFTVTKYIVIIGIAIGAYTFIQPFIDQILNTYQSIQKNTATVNEIKDSIPNKEDLPQEVSNFFKGLNL